MGFRQQCQYFHREVNRILCREQSAYGRQPISSSGVKLSSFNLNGDKSAYGSVGGFGSSQRAPVGQPSQLLYNGGGGSSTCIGPKPVVRYYDNTSMKELWKFESLTYLKIESVRLAISDIAKGNIIYNYYWSIIVRHSVPHPVVSNR